MTYNTLNDILDVDAVKKLIVSGIKRITHMDEDDNIMIGNPDGTDKGYRKGVCTYSFEVTITKPDVPEETFQTIREFLSDSIKDGSFKNIMNIMNDTVSLRDVYFRSMNTPEDGPNLRYKRGTAVLNLPYPSSRNMRAKIELAIKAKDILYKEIKYLFDEVKLDESRVELELISADDTNSQIILVQFMIMDYYSKLESSYSIANTIHTRAGELEGKYIQKVSMLDKCYIFDIDVACVPRIKKLGDAGVKSVGLQEDNLSVVNNNCQDIVHNLRNNYVSNKHLSSNCNEAIDNELGIKFDN